MIDKYPMEIRHTLGRQATEGEEIIKNGCVRLIYFLQIDHF